MINNQDLIYQKNNVEHLDDADLETKKVVEWIGKNKEVLELACHTGDLSKWLHKNGCKITGVDINSEALKVASPFLEKTIDIDIENELFWSEIKDKKYDCITCMHILEHLVDPWLALEKLKSHLKPNGYIIIALPNINNAMTRFQIFFGSFNYTKTGVLDQTHLRFFNQKTAVELIHKAGLKQISYYSSWRVNPFYYFLDYLPILNKLRLIFNKNKVPYFFKNKPNLTDVVMVFKCEH